MSTRALYSFLGEDGNYNVYKHHDGYPSGAARTIKTAIDWFAWPLPRYESDAFAAAFCAAGKIGWVESVEDVTEWATENGPTAQGRQWSGGGVRLMPQGNPTQVACKHCSDIEYRYELTMIGDVLNIRAFKGNWWDDKHAPIGEDEIFIGPFDQFVAWAMAKEAA